MSKSPHASEKTNTFLETNFNFKRPNSEEEVEQACHPLSDALKRSSNVLKLGASAQVMDYEQRFSSIRSFYEDMLETFMVDKGILEKTLEFAPGEWLLSSYIATGMENVPIFIKADNAEKEIEKYLRTA